MFLSAQGKKFWGNGSIVREQAVVSGQMVKEVVSAVSCELSGLIPPGLLTFVDHSLHYP
jgi:hypothetical protein